MELHACGTSASTEAAAGAGLAGLAVPLVTFRTVQRPGGSENGTEKGGKIHQLPQNFSEKLMKTTRKIGET